MLLVFLLAAWTGAVPGLGPVPVPAAPILPSWPLPSFPTLPPTDVRWFELDMPEVVAAKHRQLHQLGAALDAASAAAAAHPLGAAAWAALPADLGCPGWGAALQTAGLDASQPTVWVAEGELAPAARLAGERAGANLLVGRRASGCHLRVARLA